MEGFSMRRLRPVIVLVAGLMLVALIALPGNVLAKSQGGVQDDPDDPFDRLWYDDLPAADGTPQEYKTAAKWDHNPVTYSFLNCPSKLDCGAAYETVRGAVEAWDAVSGVTLNEVPSNGDIRIGWFAGDHGDGNPFDGPGNVLAHAFFPMSWIGEIAGDLHFDDSETWVIGTPGAPYEIHLRTVAMHEGGHSLGLDHSNDPSSLMWNEYTGPREMNQDDINGIQALYGPPNADDGAGGPPPPTEPPPGSPPPPSQVTATSLGTVRIRSGPGTGYAAIGALPPGTTVPVMGRNASTTWIYIDYNGLRGWVALWLMQVNGDINTVPVVNDDGSGAPTPQPTQPGNPPPGTPVPTATPSGNPPGNPPTSPPPGGSVWASTTQVLPMYSGPGPQYQQVAVMFPNLKYPVLGRTKDNQWLYIRSGQIKGFVQRSLVQVEGDLNTVPFVDANGNPIPLTGELTSGATWVIWYKVGPIYLTH